jgi:hypothetical protein
MALPSASWQMFRLYEGVSKSFRTESITKYTLTTINTRSEATQRAMAAKLTRMIHKIAIQLYLVAESCTICSARARRPVRKLLDAPSYIKYSMTASISSPHSSRRHLLSNCIQQHMQMWKRCYRGKENTNMELNSLTQSGFVNKHSYEAQHAAVI